MILLNPGPVTLSKRVRGALSKGDWCHREPEFAELTQRINAELVCVYPEMQSTFDAVMLTGSGTSAVHFALSVILKGYDVKMIDIGFQKPEVIDPAYSFNELIR